MKLWILILALLLLGNILFIVKEKILVSEEEAITSSVTATQNSNMTTSNEEVVIPSVSFSLAAIVRRGSQKKTQQYALVHERPPRGWWLPGGGIEHHDDTPVDAAIRESVEEAGTPELLQLLQKEESNSPPMPSMTHLLSLEQTPGRIRFIFRGEWVDDCKDNCDSILKSQEDEESIEARWVTWEEVQRLKGNKRGGREKIQLQEETSAASLTEQLSMNDPWLRGHEPLTYFGMLEENMRNGSIPGLPVHKIDFSAEHIDQQETEVTGAFFGRMHQSDKVVALTHGRRAALLTHLNCRLVIYNKMRQSVAVDTATNTFPSSIVIDQNEMTLKQLVDGMIADLEVLPSEEYCKEQNQVGLLRVEYIIHGNGREATLTVFPAVDSACLNDRAHNTITWVSEEDLSDDLEKNLAKKVLSEQNEKCIYRFDILRDEEGPK